MLPLCNRFGPICDTDSINGVIIMSVDEYEALRLIDYDCLSQTEGAEKMQVARTTLQGIYSSARKKVASAFVENKEIVIAGGNYSVLNKQKHRMGCMKRRCLSGNYLTNREERKIMLVVIPVDEKKEDTTVCPSFGRCPYFLLYNSQSKKIEFIDNEATNAAGGAGIKAAQAVLDTNADALITPRCGENAMEVLKATDIKVYKTKFITAKESIEAYEKEELELLTQSHPGYHHHG